MIFRFALVVLAGLLLGTGFALAEELPPEGPPVPVDAPDTGDDDPEEAAGDPEAPAPAPVSRQEANETLERAAGAPMSAEERRAFVDRYRDSVASLSGGRGNRRTSAEELADMLRAEERRAGARAAQPPQAPRVEQRPPAAPEAPGTGPAPAPAPSQSCPCAACSRVRPLTPVRTALFGRPADPWIPVRTFLFPRRFGRR